MEIFLDVTSQSSRSEFITKVCRTRFLERASMEQDVELCFCDWNFGETLGRTLSSRALRCDYDARRGRVGRVRAQPDAQGERGFRASIEAAHLLSTVSPERRTASPSPRRQNLGKSVDLSNPRKMDSPR